MPSSTGWKVVNRHGQKPPTSSRCYESKQVANGCAARLNDTGFDDGPFTVQPWGAVHGWYGVEGHREAAVERGEEPE